MKTVSNFLFVTLIGLLLFAASSSYAEEKDEQQKVTPYLCPFEKILSSDLLYKSAYYEYKDWNEIVLEKNKEEGER